MNIQQRRPFFQAVKLTLKKLDSWQRAWIAAILSATLVFGCTSLTPERVNVLAAIAGQAAAVGAQEYLAKHPEHRPGFDAVILALAAMVKAGHTNETQFVELMSSLPTSTLRGPDGEVYITEADVVIWDAHLKKAVDVKGPAVAPVVKSTLLGLRRATRPVPPTPKIAGARKPGVPVIEGVLPEGEPGVMDDYVVPPPAPPSQAAKKSHVVPSVLDVQSRDGDVPVLSVRWVQSPGSVYHIEQSDPQSPLSTNWYRMVCVTNVSGVGPTNWALPWHPSQPVGNWRVLRVKQ